MHTCKPFTREAETGGSLWVHKSWFLKLQRNPISKNKNEKSLINFGQSFCQSPIADCSIFCGTPNQIQLKQMPSCSQVRSFFCTSIFYPIQAQADHALLEQGLLNLFFSFEELLGLLFFVHIVLFFGYNGRKRIYVTRTKRPDTWRVEGSEGLPDEWHPWTITWKAAAPRKPAVTWDRPSRVFTILLQLSAVPDTWAGL